MLMVVFGAGASYGSRPPDVGPPTAQPVRRPPLTKDLLAERYGAFADRYPSSRPAIVGLRRALMQDPEQPIEAAMADLYQAAAGNPERAMHLLALRFYLCELVETVTDNWWHAFHGFTHYTELLDRLGTWRNETGEPIALVTFNYDTLLERTLEAQVGDWRLSDFGSYISRPDWHLFKLHGSVRWARVIPGWPIAGPDDANETIAQSKGVDFDKGELRPLPWSRAASGETAAAAPGIAVPTTLKQSFQCPTAHVEQFVSEIGRIDRLLTIGWRAAEPHVSELLDAHIPPGYHLAISDVTERDTIAIHENLGFAARRSPDVTPFTGGFTGLLEGDRLEEWLVYRAPASCGNQCHCVEILTHLRRALLDLRDSTLPASLLRRSAVSPSAPPAPRAADAAASNACSATWVRRAASSTLCSASTLLSLV